MDGYERLRQLAERFKSEHESGSKSEPYKVTVRDFMSWFGYERRGKYIVIEIKNKLDELELQTVPDFEFAYIDSEISIEPAASSLEGITLSEGLDDPTVRIGALEAANRRPERVAPEKPLITATTLMLLNDYSQLPVMTGQRDVKGVISWQSIGSRLALKRNCELVRHCMDPAREIGSDAPLFEAVNVISEHSYVLVRGQTQEITGIVTATDIADQFEQLARPFLLIGEIEGYLRRLVYRKFTREELGQASLGYEGGQPATGPADLTFGGYCHLLQDPQNWCRLKLPVDRAEFNRKLDCVRRIRNDVMHFDPEGLTDNDAKSLYDFASFFRSLGSIGAI